MHRRLRPATLVALGLLCAASTAHGQTTVTWLGGSNGSWATTTNWSSGTVPSTGNTVVYSSTSANLVGQLLGAARSVSGVTVSTVSGSVTIATGNSLAIGSGGVDMSAATGDFVVNAVGSLTGGTNTTVNVATGRNFGLLQSASLSGTISFVGGGTTSISGGSGYLSIGANSLLQVGSGASLQFTGGAQSTMAGTIINNGGIVGGAYAMNVGRAGNGSIVQNSGTMSFSNFAIAGYDSGRTGSVTINGGVSTLNVVSMSSGGGSGNVANNTQSSLTVAGGQLTLTGLANLATTTNSVVRVTLSGGTTTLNASINPGVLGAASTTNFTLDGGVYRPGANNVTLLQNLSNAYITNNGALIDTNGFSATISQALINGTAAGTAGPLTKLGAGTLTLSGTNSYTGVTRVNAGTLLFTNTNALYASNTANWTAANLTTGSGATTGFSVSGASGFTSANLDTLRGLATGSTGFLPGSALGIDTTGTTFTYASNIANPNGGSNALGLTKLGTGTLALSGSNTYTGVTTLAGGVLQLSSSTAIPSGGVLTFTGGTLQSSAGVNGINLNSPIQGSTSAITINPNSQNITLSGAIDSTNTAGLTIASGGTVTLSGNNAYSGTTSLSNAALTVVIGSNSAFGTSRVNVQNNNAAGSLAASQDVVLSNTVALTTTVTISGSNSIELGGVTYFSNGLSTTLTNNISSAAGKSLTLSGPIYLQPSGSSAANGASTLAGTGNTLLSGVIRDTDTGSGSSSLTINNTGTTTITGSNSYSGGTTIFGSAATVIIGNSTAFGSGTVSLSGAGVVVRAATPVTLTNPIVPSNNFTVAGTNSITWAGNVTNAGVNKVLTNSLTTGSLTISGTTALQESGTGVGRSYTLAGTGNTTFLGSIVNGGTGGSSSLTITNTGTTTLSGSSSYLGGTTLSGANSVLILGDNSALATGTVTVAVTTTQIQASTPLSGITAPLNLGAGSQLNISGSNSIAFANSVTAAGAQRTIVNNLDAGQTLTFSGTMFTATATEAARGFSFGGSGRTVVSGNIVNSGTANGAPITANGTGTVVLSGSNSYFGTTSVSSGIVLLDSANALPALSPLTVGGGVLGLGTGNSTFTRTQGSGTGQVAWNGPGGFAAFGSDAVVNIGVSGTATAPSSMTLGATSADKMVDFQSVLNLGSGAAKTLQVNDGSAAIDAKLSGAVVATSAGLTKTGAGTLWLTGSSTFTTGLTVADGVVMVDTISGTSSPNSLGQGSLTLGSGTTAGTLRYTGATASANRSFTLDGTGGVIEANGSGPLTLTGSIGAATGNRTLTLAGSNTGGNSIGAIGNPSSGTTSLVKNGAGTWLLSGSSSYAGSTTVNEGTLLVGANAQNSSTNGGLGFNSSAPITIGNAAGSGTAALLLQAGVQVDTRTVTVPTGSQLTVLGGANTTGTSTFGAANSAAINFQRDIRLQAGTGGTVVFANIWSATGGGSVPANNVTVGSAGNAGTVRINSSLGTTGAVNVDFGTLSVNGAIPNASLVSVAAGAVLAGSGLIGSNIGGDGLIAPGNSPGILQVNGQVVPTVNTSFAFELTQTGDPTWSSATASGNDVLRLTNANPFQSSLVSTNIVNVYFDVASLANGDIFNGGFYSDKTSGQLNFTSAIGAPTYAFFVYGDGNGSATSYNGKSFYSLAQYITGNPSVTGVTTSVVTVPTANFANGTVTDGQVTQFVVVPEPATLALAAVGIGLGGWATLRRRRK